MHCFLRIYEKESVQINTIDVNLEIHSNYNYMCVMKPIRCNCLLLLNNYHKYENGKRGTKQNSNNIDNDDLEKRNEMLNKKLMKIGNENRDIWQQFN